MTSPLLTQPVLDRPLNEAQVQEIRSPPAMQQPAWPDAEATASATAQLADGPGIVPFHEVQELKGTLARVASGEALVLQIGDCAESFDDSSLERVAAKTSLIRMLAELITANTGKDVVTVGRIAGQYAKPRSSATEKTNGVELPVYRGPLVNSPEPIDEARAADPRRLIRGFGTAAETYRNTRLLSTGDDRSPVWTSHEALVLDYEVPLVRIAEDGSAYLSSTHWPWIGERTRQLDHAHVFLASAISNPVACKVGPSMTEGDLLALCDRLDPHRIPGRLTLISRLGADAISDRLTRMARVVHDAGFPVAWLCDPMHANTYKSASGIKTRDVGTIIREVNAFQDACAAAGVAPGGLHLETTPDHVSECVNDPSAEHDLERAYTSLCDPRLNPSQAFTVVNEWR
ncbi:3-deoxy-7-phosphoheptulonate synthase [Arthrobacter sp. ISL-48]|uniref:3-deoxy-7-phosphoheptulonate synthase n=1 Tax=Arthrobacter sp. ISL-48 TaxID=2819110 RepID=UPI001BE5A775|nr:3-deoxy-7-phosphoheptulonate synthase [Arthrobacter sp. ISL-48]MBT2533913.1 3-deoxy-7-phosphoheptulonate synthase [Arthrobacter sp. ISL-48]